MKCRHGGSSMDCIGCILDVEKASIARAELEEASQAVIKAAEEWRQVIPIGSLDRRLVDAVDARRAAAARLNALIKETEG